MGFTCGLYKVKKFNNLDLKQINTIDKCYEYQENSWAKEQYPDWKDYCKAQDPEYFSEVTQEDIDLYKDEFVNRDYHKSIFMEYESWCSDGGVFHNWFAEKGEKITDYSWVLDKDTILAALNMCSTELQHMSFKAVKVERAFTEDEDTEVITSIPCDGVEVIDEEGDIRREYTADWEITNLYVPTDGYFDEYKYNAYTRLLDALITILITTDFDNEIVFYGGGW